MEAQVKIDLSILNVDFFRKHDACYDPADVLGEDWAGNILDLMKMENIKSEDKIWAFALKGSVPESIQRLAAVSLIRLTPLSDGRKVIDLLEDERSINALSVAERHANGEASDGELAAACADAAVDAMGGARVAAWNAARVAAWNAARGAAWNAAWEAAGAAAWVAARAVDRTVAWYAVRDAARVAARDAQVDIIIDLLESI